MRLGFVIGVGGGLASALLFYSAARGSPLLSTLLLLLTPLPTLLVGLGWGWPPAAAGAVAGSLVMAITASLPFALGYFVALGLPAAIVAHLAYLSRPDPQDPNAREWYPAGRLVAGLSLYGGALPVLVLPLIGGSYDVLRAPMASSSVACRRAPPSSASNRSTMPRSSAGRVRGYRAAGGAGGLLGRHLRPQSLSRRTHRARLRSARARLAGSAGARLSAGLPPARGPGARGQLCAGDHRRRRGQLQRALLLAYLIAGLALMHFIARGRAPWILWFVYAALVLFTPYAAVALAIGGLLEPALKLRRRFGASRPST
jgi:hypothetical protein